MIDGKKASREIGRLATLKFFPSDADARTEIYGLICERLAITNEQIEWLVKRTLQLWNEWEGPRELRAIFCSRFKPADGIEADSALERFAENGIPSETETAYQLHAPETRRLEAGEPISADPEMNAMVEAVAPGKRLSVRVESPPRLPGENDYQALLRIISECHA